MSKTLFSYFKKQQKPTNTTGESPVGVTEKKKEKIGLKNNQSPKSAQKQDNGGTCTVKFVAVLAETPNFSGIIFVYDSYLQ